MTTDETRGVNQTTEPRRPTYAEALHLLSVRDQSGIVRAPVAALVKYEDGWRVFAQFKDLGGGVRATSYVVDPVSALRGLED